MESGRLGLLLLRSDVKVEGADEKMIGKWRRIRQDEANSCRLPKKFASVICQPRASAREVAGILRGSGE